MVLDFRGGVGLLPTGLVVGYVSGCSHLNLGKECSAISQNVLPAHSAHVVVDFRNCFTKVLLIR